MKLVLVLSALLVSSISAFAQSDVFAANVNGVDYKISQKGFLDKAAAVQFCKDQKLNLVVDGDILGLAILASAAGQTEVLEATTFEIVHGGEVQSSGVIGWLSDEESASYNGADAFAIFDGQGGASETFKLKELNEELKTEGVAGISIRAICK